MTLYRTQSYYPDTALTRPYPMLFEMVDAEKITYYKVNRPHIPGTISNILQTMFSNLK